MKYNKNRFCNFSNDFKQKNNSFKEIFENAKKLKKIMKLNIKEKIKKSFY